MTDTLTREQIAALCDENGRPLFPSTESPLFRELVEAGYPVIEATVAGGHLRGVLLQRHLDGSGWILTWLGAELGVTAAELAVRHVPGTRADDRATARRAWEQINVHGLSDSQTKVLVALAAAGEYGMLDHDHEPVNGIKQDSAGKRRIELVRKGLVAEKTGPLSIRTTPRGSHAQVWVATTAGHQALQPASPPSVAMLRARAARQAAAG